MTARINKQCNNMATDHKDFGNKVRLRRITLQQCFQTGLQLVATHTAVEGCLNCAQREAEPRTTTPASAIQAVESLLVLLMTTNRTLIQAYNIRRYHTN